MDCREAKEQGKTFHYVQLLILIALISWKESKDSQFSTVEVDVCEGTRYASIWFVKEHMHIVENKMFFVVMAMDFHMVVNQYPRLSPSLQKQYNHITKFKVDFHRVYVKAMKNPIETWNPLPYLVTKYHLVAVVQDQPEEWMTPPDGAVGGEGEKKIPRRVQVLFRRILMRKKKKQGEGRNTKNTIAIQRYQRIVLCDKNVAKKEA